MSWSTPADLKAQLEKRWTRGDLLRTRLSGDHLFPMTLRLRRPTARDISERFADAQEWVQGLSRASRSNTGAGYDIEWQRSRLQVHGLNDIPRRVLVASEDLALQWLGKRKQVELFDRLAHETLIHLPKLRDWVLRHPMVLLEHADAWPRVVAVLRFFANNPRPGCYRREIDLPGVDTKFIENHSRLFTQLLTVLLPADSITETPGGKSHFDERFGLRVDRPRIRFRVLDPDLAISGLTDLAISPEDFAQLRPPCRRVFFTENKVNGLAFPMHRKALVIFGLGYGLARLREVAWLHDVELLYWGDIDREGFGILDRFRQDFATARSILMDPDTFEEHRAHWITTKSDSQPGMLENLTTEEQRLYRDLCTNRLGPRLRLEQERISYGWVVSELNRLGEP